MPLLNTEHRYSKSPKEGGDTAGPTATPVGKNRGESSDNQNQTHSDRRGGNQPARYEVT